VLCTVWGALAGANSGWGDGKDSRPAATRSVAALR